MVNTFCVFEELVFFDLCFSVSGFQILVSDSGFWFPIPDSRSQFPGFRVAP